MGGRAYAGWKSVRVRKSLDELCHSFELELSDAWAAGQEPVPVVEGDACQILYDTAAIVSGYVDDVGIQYDHKSHTLSVSGRSNTCDLVDCTINVTGSQLKGRTYRQIAEALVAPFTSQMQVVADNGDIEALLAGTPSRRPFQPEPGTSPHEALEEIARLLGCILQTTPAGDLLFARARAARIITEITPETVTRGGFSGSFRDRFSRYIFKGATEADDDWYGDKAADISGEILDQNVERYRPHIVLSEYRGNRDDMGRRAIWERNTRAGRSERLRYTVHGWEHADGLWEPNLVAHVDDPLLRFKDDMLITSVDLVLSGQEGTVAHLELQGAESYDVLDTPPSRRRRAR